MNEELCTITFDGGAVIKGVCDPSQYESGKDIGYPYWISCFLINEGEHRGGNKEIYCFHPTQGKENANHDAGKETITKLPAELPRTGANNEQVALVVLIIIWVIWGIFLWHKR